MVLKIEMLVEILQKKHKVTAKPEYQECELFSPGIYEADNVKEHHIYVIDDTRLLTLSDIPKHVAFVCCRSGAVEQYLSDYNVIVVEEQLKPISMLNELIAIFDMYNKWEQQLFQCAHNYDGLKEIVNIGSVMMGGELLLADSNFNWIVSSDHFKQYAKDGNGINVRGKNQIITDELLRDPKFYAVSGKKDVFVYDHNEASLCCNLFRQGENSYYGRLMFVNKTHVYTKTQTYLLQYLAKLVDKIFSQMSTFSLPISTYSSLKQVVKKLLKESGHSENLMQSVLTDLHWSANDTYVLIQLEPALGEDMNVHLAICSRLESLYPESCAIIHEETILLLINITRNGGRDKFHVRSKLPEFLRKNMYKAGISKFFDDIRAVGTAYWQAKAALSIGGIKHRTYWYFYFEDYVLDYMVTTCEREIPFQYLCHDGIVILEAYDENHRTEYVKTLYAYLKNNYSMKKTADELYIHRTTLQSRLDRIMQLINVDLDDWNIRLHLMLSFYMKMK